MRALHGDDEARAMLSAYDAEADAWAIPLNGSFWSAIAAAHAGGHRGAGRAVAIIDTAFDTSVPRLRAHNRLATPARPLQQSAHGTVVALLVSTVAPEAQLDLYECAPKGWIDKKLILRAMERARTSDVSVVTTSLGDESPFSVDLLAKLDPTPTHCKLCKGATETARAGKAMVAAIGNASTALYCPAKCEEVLAVGFRQTEEIIRPVKGGLTAEVRWAPPGYDQTLALNQAFTIEQPPGVVGSSFAAPLMAGALALTDAPGEALLFARASGPAADASFLETLHPSEGAPADSSADTDRREMIAQLYARAFRALPHHHAPTDPASSCLMCALFCESIYVNAGRFLLTRGRLSDAADLFASARKFALWSPSAIAGLGRVHESLGLMTERPLRDRYFDLVAASACFEEALRLRPDFPPYLKELDKLRSLLAQWQE